jgi:hypothetical protein
MVANAEEGILDQDGDEGEIKEFRNGWKNADFWINSWNNRQRNIWKSPDRSRVEGTNQKTQIDRKE